MNERSSERRRRGVTGRRRTRTKPGPRPARRTKGWTSTRTRTTRRVHRRSRSGARRSSTRSWANARYPSAAATPSRPSREAPASSARSNRRRRPATSSSAPRSSNGTNSSEPDSPTTRTLSRKTPPPPTQPAPHRTAFTSPRRSTATCVSTSATGFGFCTLFGPAARAACSPTTWVWARRYRRWRSSPPCFARQKRTRIRRRRSSCVR
mmetsp:Transcript_7483/g.33802  ORF Transcript_7483/g.33802 Transcript_7483/m.33802 type:complete len:208 (+) Transcript_7483:238-861(+)